MSVVPPYITAPVLDFVRAELIVNCFVVLLMLVVVSLRIYARVRGAGIGVDDILILIAAPLGVGMLICQGFFAPVGTGYTLATNMQFLANSQFIFFLTFIMEMLYVPCLALSKASMLFFYRRVFSTSSMHRLIDISLVVLLCWTISFMAACIFICTPVNFFWLRVGEGKCGEYVPMIQALIATNAFGDLIIMAMPVQVVWGLQMKKTEKLGIMASFALAISCVVIAIFRVIYLAKVDLAGDITGTMATTVLLFALEPNLAILSVSIPMLRPLYTSWRKRNQSSRLYDDKLNSGSNGLRTIGGGGGGAAIATGGHHSQGHRSKFSKSDPLEETVWEMEHYRPKNEANTATTVAVDGASSSSGGGSMMNSRAPNDNDDAGSEKSLTKYPYLTSGPNTPSASAMRSPSNGGIGVKTTWTVTRDL
ncbi:hypothetical protein Micbo1qcDRAFT_32455 [Microdochium bolleyi]|uniref:Rhodopsin domain-containing protein n=1 Tax=Microdochium bolleyi TaxID=196109 RepID=A0A136IQF8_9PEZI|nr:hypothetical protein Micbo1qcDRAFT_32455 [Microdochium bolleyi]